MLFRSGYGDLVSVKQSASVTVTADDLIRGKACAESVRKFRRLFPDGGRWPEDIDKAKEAGFDVSWCRRLGLFPPIGG